MISYYFINEKEPIILCDTDDINIVKKKYKTNNVIRLNKKQYEELLSAYIVYNTIINEILSRR